MLSAWFCSWTFTNESVWALVMTLRSITCSDVSCSNTHDSSPVRVQSRKLVLSWQVWINCWHDVCLRCFCSPVSLCGTYFGQIFLFRKSSCRIRRITSFLMFNSSDIILKAHRRSHVTILRTFAIVWGWRTPASWNVLKILTPVF
jgi:hypothetical protein